MYRERHETRVLAASRKKEAIAAARMRILPTVLAYSATILVLGLVSAQILTRFVFGG